MKQSFCIKTLEFKNWYETVSICVCVSSHDQAVPLSPDVLTGSVALGPHLL